MHVECFSCIFYFVELQDFLYVNKRKCLSSLSHSSPFPSTSDRRLQALNIITSSPSWINQGSTMCNLPRTLILQRSLITHPFYFQVHSFLAWKFTLRRLQNGERLIRLRFAIGVAAFGCDVCLHGLDRLGQLLAAFLVNIVELDRLYPDSHVLWYDWKGKDGCSGGGKHDQDGLELHIFCKCLVLRWVGGSRLLSRLEMK